MKAASNPIPTSGAPAPPRRRTSSAAEKGSPASPTPKSAEHGEHEDAIVRLALRILESRFRAPGAIFDSPDRVREYLRLQLGSLPHEVFAVLFLDAQHRLIAMEEMFRGTLAQTSVYPREVVKRVIERGAAAVVFAHNHPSGLAEPSRADEFLTRSLKAALALIDVRVLDHLVVGHDGVASFAERGLL